VKRSRERDNDPDQDKRDEKPQGPLWVEPIAPPRSDRQRYGLPALIGVFVALALVVAMITRFVNYFTEPAATPSPTLATPIAWVDTTFVPPPTNGPSAVPLPLPSDSTLPSASYGPATSTPSGSPTPAATPSHPVTSLRASIDSIWATWYLGTENHFTLNLTNTSPVDVDMSPCPAYRMYITGTNRDAAPLRLLNCAALGATIQPGQTISLDMVYTPTVNDPRGPNQQLVWEWVSPNTIQATTTAGVNISA
jgi:hypothetical protein